MNFNKKILYALMVAGLCMPATSVYAVWPFSSPAAAPILKIQEKAKEEVKKEATAQSARLLSAAVKGTGFVASKTAEGVLATTNEAVRLGLKYPYATTALIAGGTVYYYRNEIKEKVKNAASTAAEYAGKAAPYVATATGLAAAKYGYDWCKSLFGSKAAPAQNNNAAPVVAAPVAAPVNNWANEFAQQNAAASQTEKATVEPVVPVTAPAALAQDWAQEFNGSHSVPRTNSAELRRMESAWKHIEEARSAQEKVQKEESEAKAQAEQKARLANTAKARANIFASHDIKSAQNNAQEFYRDGRLAAQADNQLMDAFIPREFTFEQLAQDKLNELTNVNIATMPYEPQESGAEEWAQEFIESNKHEDAEALKWVEEYNNTQALNRVRRIMDHLVPFMSRPNVSVVRSLEDINERMHQREMIATVNNLMPHCAPASLRPL